MDRRTVHGVHFLRVRGTMVERARAHGKLLREDVARGPLTFLAARNPSLIRRAPGRHRLPGLVPAAVWMYEHVVVPFLTQRVGSEYRAAMRALSDASGVPLSVVRGAFFQPDGFTLLAWLTKTHDLQVSLPPTAGGACSSVVVQRAWTRDGHLLVGRNLDYPASGYWEPHTTVVFHEPSETGQMPYVGVTSAGVHTASLTAVNAAGLTLAAHVVVGRQCDPRGRPFLPIGEEIIRGSRSLDEAIDRARRVRPLVPWSFVVSSAAEDAAVVLELTPSGCRVVGADDGFLSHSNSLRAPEHRAREAVLSGAVCEDFESRRCRLRAVCEPLRGALGPEHLAAALADTVDPLSGESRVVGNTVANVTTVASVVIDATARRLWVSTRCESPTALGDFVEVDLDGFWAGDPDASLPVLDVARRESPALIAATRHFRAAYRAWQLEEPAPGFRERVVAELRAAAGAFPADGHLWLLLGLVLFAMERFAEADVALREARGRKLSEHVAAVCELFLARGLDLRGERAAALAIYAQGERVRDARLQRAYAAGRRRGYRAREARLLDVDLQFPDALGY